MSPSLITAPLLLKKTLLTLPSIGDQISRADIFFCSVSDASTDINVADIITDFSNRTDEIGLEDKTFSDLTITQISSGSFSGDVQIKDTSSNKILFLLDDTDVGLIDADDFIVTDFV